MCIYFKFTPFLLPWVFRRHAYAIEATVPIATSSRCLDIGDAVFRYNVRLVEALVIEKKVTAVSFENNAIFWVYADISDEMHLVIF